MCSGNKTICRTCGEEEMNFNDICSAADAPSYGIPHRILGLTEYIDKCSDCLLAERIAEEKARRRHREQIPHAKAVLEYLNGERSTLRITPVSFSEWVRERPVVRSSIDDGILGDIHTYINKVLKPSSTSQALLRGSEFMRTHITFAFVIHWVTVTYTHPPLLGTYKMNPPTYGHPFSGPSCETFRWHLRHYILWLTTEKGEFAATDLANFKADCRAICGQLRSLFTETQAAEPGKPLSFGQWVVLKLPTRRTKPWEDSSIKSKLALELAAYTAYLVSAGWTDAAAAFRLQAAEMVSVHVAPMVKGKYDFESDDESESDDEFESDDESEDNAEPESHGDDDGDIHCGFIGIYAWLVVYAIHVCITLLCY